VFPPVLYDARSEVEKQTTGWLHSKQQPDQNLEKDYWQEEKTCEWSEGRKERDQTLLEDWWLPDWKRTSEWKVHSVLREPDRAL
jgi:hypothetical protein